MSPTTLPASLTRTSLRRLAHSRPTTCLLRTAAHRSITTSTTTPTRPSPTLQQPLRRATRQHQTRPLHYPAHPSSPSDAPFSPPELALLRAAYAHVPQHGFSAESLALGARDIGLLDISTNLLPNGDFDLIRYHLFTQREALVEKSRGLQGSVRDRVFELTWLRLLGNREVVGRWQEALAIMAQPSYVPASLSALHELVDDIWYLAGDVSVDPSWYTKRASLSAIYVSAELFMTDDRSAGFEETKAFLRRRFDEVGELSSVLGAVREWVSFSGSSAINVLRSKGVPTENISSLSEKREVDGLG
ncbi:Ubiquinone biosynthesis protein coq9, mitochondrial [Coniochaeta pulveracea]|uniref:Ubiquinone biosynthesis protein n=1 Tax=Coniochaeta pulveracea TaxID=177199 RepID=A0A420Y9K3_9PEZI|nr:Ubiquinone biosynthesis protein coq9, mitochondrial [Coniochaeta pulveracea]